MRISGERRAWTAWPALLVLVTAAACLLPAAPATARPRSGGLTLKAVGLPRGERASLAIEGPRPSGHGRQTRRFRIGVGRTLRRLPAGTYRLRVIPVRVRHRHRTIRRGAVATPVKRRLRVRVRPGRVAKAELRYGTIVNPGVRSARGRIVRVLGDPANPSGVVLSSLAGIHRGTVLSAPPRAGLPQGLLARVTKIHRAHHQLRAEVVAVSMYEVAPNMSFDVPLSATDAAAASALLKCGPSDDSSLTPFVRVSDIHLSGHWTTTRVLFAHVTNGATVELHFRAGAGIDMSAARSFSCSLPLRAFPFQGMAGPIPVYGAIRPKVSAEVAGAGKLHTEGSTEITLGASAAVPGGARPIVRFSSPRFTFGVDPFAGLKAGVGVDAELGLGVADAGNLHVALGNSLDLTAAPGNCSWDLALGEFSIGGRIGPVAIQGPSSPPLYRHNLWHGSCGAALPPPPPAPAPPALSGPQTRATMSWDSDSDIDLYAWDGDGQMTYFGDTEAIPDALLVEDVIPDEYEYDHAPEVFQETGSYGRPYTFGICDYRGAGGDVTLTVVDPGGTARVFHHTFEEEGEGEVVTTSPLGSGYVPPYGWCRHEDEWDEYEYEEEEW